MKFALYANTVSPHQLPLARGLVKRLGAGNYRYVYTTPLTDERKSLGWGGACESWILEYRSKEAQEWLKDADVVLMQHNRDWKLFEERLGRGKVCIYASERWFKPGFGLLRLLWPKYLKMALRFVRMLQNREGLIYFPIGIHAARDMARLCGLVHGDLRCLFRAPELEFERKAGGRVLLRERGTGNGEQDKKYCLDKMRMWGYFVEAGNGERGTGNCATSLKVLWVGRLLDLKRVDTIIKAVGENGNLVLDIYGTGPMEERLKKMAARYGDMIKFYNPVPISEVRNLMHEHEVYVLASNAYEGWGAVVSEALEEGMRVVGTYEAGASATILPERCLFHAGDVEGLKRLLSAVESIPEPDVDKWSASSAADSLLELVK